MDRDPNAENQQEDQREEQRSSPEVRTGFIPGNTFEYQPVQYAVVDGKAMFEGDIVLGSVEEMEALAEEVVENAASELAPSGPQEEGEEESSPSMDVEPDEDADTILEGVVISGFGFRWRAGVVPFTIDASLANQARVTDAIRHWRERTPIRFVRRDASNQGVYPDWVHFQDDGSGCNSQVGRRGGRQNINLAGGCALGSTIHEIGHAVGVWHEQSREDRDRFVRIQWANIQAGFAHNFNQHISDGDDIGPYDYGSIMHYPANAFSATGQPTIVALQTLPAGVTMGQRTGLSRGDIAAVRAIYPVRSQSGFLQQSNFGARGNFELVLPRPGGGLNFMWRNNDGGGFPWSGASAFGGSTGFSTVSMIQSNFGIPGNLEVIARSGTQLVFFWRDSGPTFGWSGGAAIASGAGGNPALIQSNFGMKGNFEMVVPRSGGGLAHYWRNNDAGSLPWAGPFGFGGTAFYGAAALIQSNFGFPGNLELAARRGSDLVTFWRDSGPGFNWNGPNTIASGIRGRPALIQSAFGGRGNFELVVPRASGGLAHFWRNNDLFWHPWSGPNVFGAGTGLYDQVSLVQSNFGAPGNLEVIARTGGQWMFFWRDSGPAFRWNGPFRIA